METFLWETIQNNIKKDSRGVGALSQLALPIFSTLMCHVMKL